MFRKPEHPLLLSVLVGVGLSLFIELSIGTILYTLIGKYVVGLLLAYHPLFALCNGIIASRLFLLFNGKEWAFLTFASALTLPSFVFLIFFTLNLLSPTLIQSHFGASINSRKIFLLLCLTNCIGVGIGALQGFM